MPVGQNIVTAALQLGKYVIDEAYHNRKLPGELYSTAVSLVQPNSPYLNELFGYIEQNVPGAAQGSYVNDGILKEACRVWIDWKLKQLVQMAQAQRQPAGFLPSGVGGSPMYGMPVAIPSTAGLYSSGNAPITPMMSAASPPPMINPVAHTPVSTPIRIEEMPVQQPASISLRETSDIAFAPMRDASVTNNYYALGDYNGTRVSISKFAGRRAYNSVEEAYRNLSKTVPVDYKTGLWFHTYTTSILTHLPIRTDFFVDKIIGPITNNKSVGWQNILEIINGISMSRTEMKSIDTLLTYFINHHIGPQLHQRNSGTLYIDSIGDLDDLRKVTKSSKVTTHEDYLERLDTILDQIFNGLFDSTKIIKPDDKHLGDFIHCDGVSYFDEDGTTEYDYGSITGAADKANFLKILFEKNTVLRVPTRFGVTNMVNPKFLIPPQHPPFYTDQDPRCLLNCVMLKFPVVEAISIRNLICIDPDSGNIFVRRFGMDLDENYAVYSVQHN